MSSPRNRLCEKRARAENAQNCFLSFLLSTVTARAVLFLFNVIETNFLRASSTSEFSHSLGQKRRFGDVRLTSALPLKADIHNKGRLVRKVPLAEVIRSSSPPPADVDRVFEAFYTTKPSGLGLGLLICRSIIEAHNGQLWASANLPRGATFEFTVSAHPDIASCLGAAA